MYNMSYAGVPARMTEVIQSGGAQLVRKNIMYVVYVLQDKNGKYYKGFTNNLARRFSEHKSGHTKSTKKMCDLQIVYTEEYRTLLEARKREVYFKTAAGRRFLKKIMRA